MIPATQFVRVLKERGVRSFTGVPCSFFQSAINGVIADKDLSYTIAANEGNALALAAGSYLSGGLTAVMIQNSGFGNLINPLTSLQMIYGIPALIFMSGRAYGVSDEPQHEIIGRCMGPMLDAMGVKHEDMPGDLGDFMVSLERALEYVHRQRQPFFFLVRKGTVEESAVQKSNPERYPMTRWDAIGLLADLLGEDHLVIATTGKPSRELFAQKDKPNHFYMQGSMGHAAAVGLGVAMNRPEKKVVVLDGDGALLMHLGILSTVGHYRPQNFVHVVLDNESYETTGDQDTTSTTTDFVHMAQAAGYAQALQVSDAAALTREFQRLLTASGPALLRVKINRRPTHDIPRISGKHTSRQITDRFRLNLGL